MPAEEGFDLAPYKEIVEHMIREVGLTPDDCYITDGDYWSLQKGSVPVCISLFYVTHPDGEEEWYMDISSNIMPVPSENLLPFYRRLLDENASRVAVKFSIRENEVWVEITRELEGISFDEAYRNMTRVGDTADEMDDILREEFS